MSQLFDPLRLRALDLRNRIAISPMCMYSAIEGTPTDWHVVHLGARAAGGAGLIIAEATAVEARGRITYACAGLYDDSHIEPWSRVTRFAKSQGAKVAVQLAHAGMKAGSTSVKVEHVEPYTWTPIGPTDRPFSRHSTIPTAMTEREVDQVIDAFVRAADRAIAAGFDAIEIHAAHGYLLHSFYSPLTNTRSDSLGGSFENRTKILRRVVESTRRKIPDSMPLLVRLSCSDWVEGGWTVDDSVQLSVRLRELGVDLIDCSSGGATPDAKIAAGPGYQVPFAREIRQRAGIATGAVGEITSAKQAESILEEGSADLILVGRQSLRDPNFPLNAARELGVADRLPPPRQYARAW